MHIISKLQALLGLVMAPALHAQPPLNQQLRSLALGMRCNNLYHQLIWDFSPTNPYSLSQDNGTITYSAKEGSLQVVAEIEILGSFYLKDNTFLWADKNKSIDTRWSSKVAGFRSLLPVEYQNERIKTTVSSAILLLAAFGGHLQANGVDFVRQQETILFFAFNKVSISKNSTLVQTITPQYHFLPATSPEILEKIQAFHAAYASINVRYNQGASADTCFDALDALQQAYCIDSDAALSLKKPFDMGTKYGHDYEVVRFEAFPQSVFIVFSDGRALWPDTHRAYEIDPGAKGKRIIKASFGIYGL